MLLAHPGCCEKCCCVRWAGTLLCCRPSTSRRAVTFKCSINPCERIKCPLGTQGGKRSRSEPAGLTEPLGTTPWNPRAGRGPAQSPLASRNHWGGSPGTPGQEEVPLRARWPHGALGEFVLLDQLSREEKQAPQEAPGIGRLRDVTREDTGRRGAGPSAQSSPASTPQRRVL